MTKVFDDVDYPDENHLMEQMEKGTQSNFPDVMNGDQQSLIRLPDNVFHYGKGKEQVVINIQLILDKIKMLEEQIGREREKNPNPTLPKEIRKRELNLLERDHMKNLADGLLTEQAEGDIYHRFEELLHDEVGFMVHGYLPETYLQTITTRAKDQRKTLLQQTTESKCSLNDYAKFTKLETKLQDVLGLRKIVSDEADRIFDEIQKIHPVITTFTADILQKGIKSQAKKADKIKLSTVASNIISGLTYDQAQANTLIEVGLLHHYANQSGEIDLLICLPEFQAILNAEVKYQLDQNKDATDQAIHLLSEATKQVSSHDDYLTRVHGQTFSKGWKFHKIAAVLPGAALEASGICSDVPIITSETLKSKESFYKWFQMLGLKKTYKHHEGNPSSPVYKEYSAFFQRVVGSMHLIEYSQSSWHKVMGPNFKSSINSTGCTESHPVPPTKDVIKTKDGKLMTKKHDNNPKKSGIKNKKYQSLKIKTITRHWDMETRPLDWKKTLYLTRQQRSALLDKSRQCLKTLFFGDFGSGNNSFEKKKQIFDFLKRAKLLTFLFKMLILCILGKTVILRKKAISVKEQIDAQGLPPNEAPNVFYIALTSCDRYGRPELPVNFFDGATKRSFKNHHIEVVTVHDLLVDFQQAYPDWDGKLDLFPRSSETDHEKNHRLTKLFENNCKKAMAGKMDVNEFTRTMNQNGINGQNAVQEVFRRIRNPNFQVSHLDVYDMLFSFIKRHRKDHIFVDEFAIHHSMYCKLNLL